MTPDSPPLDLLVVGGLTVDRFPDGSSAPGGTPLHVARAAATRALRMGVVTAAGPEPEAQAGLDELRRLTALVECTLAEVTATFRHRESADGRRLWLEQHGGPVPLGADVDRRIRTRAILYAPVAGEVAPEELTVWDGAWERGAILQGWLRGIDPSDEVRPQPLSALDDRLLEALRGLDLLVASREDLLAEAIDPSQQLRSMRLAFGRHPTLIVTDGIAGVWIDPAAGSRTRELRHLPAPWVVDSPSTVGSGDIFAAFMAMRTEGRLMPVERRAEEAMRVVAEVLDERTREARVDEH